MKKTILAITICSIAVVIFEFVCGMISTMMKENSIAIIAISFAVGIVAEGLVLGFGIANIVKENKAQLNYIITNLNSIKASSYRSSKEYDSDSYIGSDMKELVKTLSALDMQMYNYSIEKYKLDFVLDNIKQGVITLDYDSRISICNKWLRKILGKEDTIIGVSLFDLLQDKKLIEDLKITIAEKKNAKFDYEYNGRIFTLRFYYINNVGIEYMINIYDNTYERKNETLRNEFLFNASYELNKPIKQILECADSTLANKNATEKDLKASITKIEKYASTIDAILQDTSKLARIDAKNDPDDFDNYSLSAVIDEVKKQYSREIKSKNLTHIVEGDALIYASKTYLRELIDNIYSNAVSYNKPNGEIRITIKENDKKVNMSIADTGIGIDKKHQARIFERFYVVDQTRTDNTGSTGLGLAIVKHIANNLNAKVTFESELGKGTIFTVSFRK